MGSVVRGPNLPPRVVGSLQGYFNVHLQNVSIDKRKDCDEIRIVFWGLPDSETPRIRSPAQTDSYTVVCPVVTEWALFDEYLRQAKALVVEKKAPVEELTILDAFKETKGSIQVSVWIDVPVQRDGPEDRKRRRVADNAPPEIVIDSIAELFDVLESNMSSQGIRLIDIYRFCNKLNTPVADMTSLIDRYVDRGVPLIHRNQFWSLLDPQGGRIFTFADFSQRFKNAKRAVQTIQTGIKLEVPVTTRFKEIYADLVATQPQQKLYKDMDTKTLIGHLRRCAPDVARFDEACMLATLFLELPKQTNWTLEEIRHALKMKSGVVKDDVSESEPQLESEAPATPKGDATREPSQENDGDGGRAERTEEMHQPSKEDTPSEVAPQTQTVQNEQDQGAPSNQSSPDEPAPLEKPTNLKSLQLEPEPVRPPVTNAESVQGSSEALSAVGKRNVSQLLNGLIAKCEVLLKEMPTCAQAVPAVHMTAGALPVSVGPHAVPAAEPGRKLQGLGLPDDPEKLVQDTICETLMLHTPHVAMAPHVISKVTKGSGELAVPQTSNPTERPTQCQAACKLDWIRVVVHQLVFTSNETNVTATFKSRNFSKTVKWLESSEDIAVLVPVRSSDSQLCLVIEIRSARRSRASLTHGTPEGGVTIAYSIAVEIVGVVKIQMALERLLGGDRSLDHALCPIVDVFSTEDRGVAEISLCSRPATTLAHTSTPSRGLETAQQSGDEHPEAIHPVTSTESAVDKQQLPQGNAVQDAAQRDETGHDTQVSVDDPSVDGKSTELLSICVHHIQLLAPVEGCCVCCSLEKAPSIEYKSPIALVTESESRLFPISFRHCFVVPDKERDAWLAQSLILKVESMISGYHLHYRPYLKVMSVGVGSQIEELVGELQLDLSCVSRFGRICGRMSILNHELKKTGDMEIDIQLQSSEQTAFPDLAFPEHKVKLERAPVENRLPRIPLQTCSDDDDFVVIGGLECETFEPRDEEMDELCDLFLKGTDLEKPESKPHPLVPCSEGTVQDPFFCDDDFLLDITKGDVKGEIQETQRMVVESWDAMPTLYDSDPELDPHDDILIERLSSDQLTKHTADHSWGFKTMPPVNPHVSETVPTDFLDEAIPEDHAIPIDGLCITDSQDYLGRHRISSATGEVEKSEGKGSVDSVDIDDLLQKYNIERRPGWWKSLMADEPSTHPDP